MDDHRFDAMIRMLAGSRRTVLGGAVAAVAGVAARPETGARKRRKRCKAPKVKCGKKCLRAGSCCRSSDCGPCQVCSGKRCVLAPAGSACGVGGSCNGTACINQGSFGCTHGQDFCGTGEIAACPGSRTPEARCFVQDGDPLCAVGDCVIAATDEECQARLGAGAVRLECATCTLLSPPPGWAACVVPVVR
jgi:hypothetical protein